jgi:hypothetical protein
MRPLPQRRIIVVVHDAAALEQLSPELVMILPPEVAAIARMTLPDPGSLASVPSTTSAARRVYSLDRAVTLAAVYAAVVAVTVPPLALMLRAAPAHMAQPLRVNHDLRAERNHPH